MACSLGSIKHGVSFRTQFASMGDTGSKPKSHALRPTDCFGALGLRPIDEVNLRSLINHDHIKAKKIRAGGLRLFMHTCYHYFCFSHQGDILLFMGNDNTIGFV